MDFISWKNRELHKSKFFIADGIINKELWDRAPLKVLFIMKEAYETSPEDSQEWALNEYLRNDLNSIAKPMWWSIAQWLDGLNELCISNEVAPFNEEFKTKPELDLAFHSSAVINLKKSSGKSSSTTDDLSMYVEQDWDLLWVQIKKINPDLIICGATYPLIASKLGSPKKSAEWLYEAKGYHFVDFWHPSNQWPYKVKYYSLLTALKQSRSIWLPKELAK